MGHQFTIESEEALANLTELASITGKSVEEILIETLRDRLKAERLRRSEMTRMQADVAAFQATLQHPWPSSDHSFLYDPETGLPA